MREQTRPFTHRVLQSKGYNVDIEATLNEDVYSLVNNSGYKNLFNIE